MGLEIGWVTRRTNSHSIGHNHAAGRAAWFFFEERKEMKSSKLLWNLIAATVLVCTTTMASAQDSGKLPPGIVARQGGVEVSLQDVDAYAQKIPEADRPAFFDSPKRIESMITSMLLAKQLAVEARAQNLEAEPDVKVQIEQATDDVLARAAMVHYRKTLKLPDFDTLAQEYYLSHKDQFVAHGVVNVKHVLVGTKDRSDEEAKARIDEVAATAHAHPDQFDALVEKYSDDPSKESNHGLIEDAASDKTVAPFSHAAAALKKPGELSPVVKTDFGYHVLKLVSRTPDKQRSFADVHQELVEKLRREYIENQATTHTGELRGKPLDAERIEETGCRAPDGNLRRVLDSEGASHRDDQRHSDRIRDDE